MNWLVLLYFLKLGYSPFYDSRNVMPVSNIRIRSEDIYFITLDAEAVLLANIFIGGTVKTYMQNEVGKNFFPIESDYLFKVGLRYKNIEMGFRHFCLHPVRPYEMYYQPQGSTDASYEEFYIKISGEF